MARTDTDAVRRHAAVFISGAAGTAVSGALVQLVVLPSTNVPDDRWSYPWNAGVFVVVSLLYIVLHLLVADGLLAFRRSGMAGASRAASVGVTLAIAGTLLLAVGEVASIPIRDALVDDTSAGVVGAIFGLATVLSAIGLLLIGKATLSAQRWHGWRRYTPLMAGLWTTALIGVAATDALAAGVAVYGVCLLGMAVALYTSPAPAVGTEVGELQMGRA